MHEAQNVTESTRAGPVRRSRRDEDGLLPYDHSRELRNLIERLKRQRIRQGVSLGELARSSEQARSALSRLENGRYANPTLNTLYRYARALGWDIRLSTHPLGEDGSQADTD
jgi:DNA-binding XRE family transcriptional regulator